MGTVRTCIDCDVITDATRCQPCSAERQRRRDQERGSAHARGYDRAHKRTRIVLLSQAIGQPCPRCGEAMLEGQALDLGHSTARATDVDARGDRIEHAHCNRSAGAR